jgi:hypothetical protein
MKRKVIPYSETIKSLKNLAKTEKKTKFLTNSNIIFFLLILNFILVGIAFCFYKENSSYLKTREDLLADKRRLLNLIDNCFELLNFRVEEDLNLKVFTCFMFALS